MPNPKHTEGAHPLILGALAALASACSGNVVELGEDTTPGGVPSVASLCQSSTTLRDGRRIERQADLDQLAGCEEINGDLAIVPIAHPDFTPLASLRVVTGALILGADGEGTGAPPYTPTHVETQALIAAGWLDSLEGFENLESVGSLAIEGISAPSLSPLSNLRAVAQGGFQIAGCTGLKDLSGLEGLTGWTGVELSCDSLQSLRGLSFPTRLGALTIHGAHLKDLAGVSEVTEVDQLDISETGLENLDGLRLGQALGGVSIASNPELRNVDALGELFTTNYISIEDNRVLEALPQMSVISVQHLSVRNNAALRVWPTFSGTLQFFDAESAYLSVGDLARFRENVVEVSGNPLLQSVVLPAGWQGAAYISIENNASLALINFSTAKSVTDLSIENNATIAHVELGALDTVNTLTVTGNPLLPLTDFDIVRTFDRQMSTEPAAGVSPP